MYNEFKYSIQIGDSSNAKNYRPIAITCVLSKIMEKAINEQVLRHLKSNKLIHNKQYGFRQHRSTSDILAYVTHIRNKTLEAGNETLDVALDISKASDMEWHKNLFAKVTSCAEILQVV